MSIPVIIDTDIAGDIDDTWALAMALKCPELDLKLVTTCTGDTPYRTKVAARMLQIAGRTDVPVGIGILGDKKSGPQAEWVADYELSQYPGRIEPDGVQALIDTIMASPVPITLIAIGPLMNIAEALRRQPAIAGKCRFVGMHGNIRKPFGDAKVAIPEYNVKADVPSSRAAFTAAWPMTVTPLDTCGFVVLKDKKYAAVRDCREPVTAALMENYHAWGRALKRDTSARSSVLFDTVAVYLAFTQELLTMERLGIRIGDDGMTIVDPSAKQVDVATEWKDLGGFEDFLVDRLIRK